MLHTIFKPKRACHRTLVGLLAKTKPSQLTKGQSLTQLGIQKKASSGTHDGELGTVLLRFRHTIWLVSKNDIQLRREATKEKGGKSWKRRLEKKTSKKKANKGETSFLALT